MDSAESSLMIAIIKTAIKDYQTSEYPSLITNMRWQNARLDALSFFHGKRFRDICQMFDLNYKQILSHYKIPGPRSSCQCQECKRDYTDIAAIVVNKQEARYFFALNSRHIVEWVHTDSMHSYIAYVMPIDARKQFWLTAREYLERKGVQHAGILHPMDAVLHGEKIRG
jgi:hypothetical protein